MITEQELYGQGGSETIGGMLRILGGYYKTNEVRMLVEINNDINIEIDGVLRGLGNHADPANALRRELQRLELLP